MNKKYYEPKLYTEDEIILIGESLKELKGKAILDYNLDFFKLIDYDIKSMEVEMFNWFGKNLVVNMFYIETMTLTNGEEEFNYSSEKDDGMCTALGVDSMMEYRERFIKQQKNYLAFNKCQNMKVNED